jgi:hypothetical protein
MIGWQKVVASCKEDRERMLREIKGMEAGTSIMRKMVEGRWVDTTADWIKEYRRQIAVMDEIIELNIQKFGQGE